MVHVVILLLSSVKCNLPVLLLSKSLCCQEVQEGLRWLKVQEVQEVQEVPSGPADGLQEVKEGGAEMSGKMKKMPTLGFFKDIQKKITSNSGSGLTD